MTFLILTLAQYEHGSDWLGLCYREILEQFQIVQATLDFLTCYRLFMYNLWNDQDPYVQFSIYLPWHAIKMVSQCLGRYLDNQSPMMSVLYLIGNRLHLTNSSGKCIHHLFVWSTLFIPHSSTCEKQMLLQTHRTAKYIMHHGSKGRIIFVQNGA